MKTGLFLSFTSACMVGVQAVKVQQEDWWMVSPSTTTTAEPVASTADSGSAIDTSQTEWQWLVSDPAPSTATTESTVEDDVATSLTTDSQEPLSFGTFTMVEAIEPEESTGSREPIAEATPETDLSDISFLMTPTPAPTTTEPAPATTTETLSDVAASEIPADGSAPTEDNVATDLSMFLNTSPDEFDVAAAAAEAERLAAE